MSAFSSRWVSRALGAAALVLLGGTVAVGLSLPPTEEQDVYSRLIAIHPPIAWVAYLSFGVMALGSALYLLPATRRRTWDQLAGAAGEIGVLFTTLMLATGSIWGRPTWGVWWTWDARLTLSALMLALLLGYVALRRLALDRERRAVISGIAGLGAVLVVPINHFAVTWWRTLHQGRSIVRPAPQSELDGEFIQAMLLGFIAMTLVFAWLLIQRFRVEQLEDELEDVGLEAAISARRAEAEGELAAWAAGKGNT